MYNHHNKDGFFIHNEENKRATNLCRQRLVIIRLCSAKILKGKKRFLNLINQSINVKLLYQFLQHYSCYET
jgi:hypothetical protein